MKSLKLIIPTLFEEDSLDRVDFYIDKINESLKSTNKLFMTSISIIILTTIGYHLLMDGTIKEINLAGQKFTSIEFIKNWFLTVPSLFICLSSFIGYLRVYQKESIEWLLAKHRNKEFKSEIFRLTLPPSYILGLDLFRRQNDFFARLIAKIPSFFFSFATIIAPMAYINVKYIDLLVESSYNFQVIASYSICNLLILCGLTTIVYSQRI